MTDDVRDGGSPRIVEQLVDSAGVAINVATAGGGRPVLLLHGFPDSWKLWTQQINTLARNGFRVIAPDLRGHGDSDRPEDVASYRMPLLLSDVTAVLDHFGVAGTAVAGHDWGAALAWNLAFRHPDRVERVAVLSVGHPGAGVRSGLTQRQLSWYMLWFQHVGVAEAVLPANDWLAFRQWAWNSAAPGTEPEMDRQIQNLTRPGALVAALNLYRANIRPDKGQHEPRHRDQHRGATTVGTSVRVGLRQTGNQRRDPGGKYRSDRGKRPESLLRYVFRDVSADDGAGHFRRGIKQFHASPGRRGNAVAGIGLLRISWLISGVPNKRGAGRCARGHRSGSQNERQPAHPALPTDTEAEHLGLRSGGGDSPKSRRCRAGDRLHSGGRWRDPRKASGKEVQQQTIERFRCLGRYPVVPRQSFVSPGSVDELRRSGHLRLREEQVPGGPDAQNGAGDSRHRGHLSQEVISGGSRIRPGVPGDGCHPSREALAAVAAAGQNGPVREKRERQVITELEATSNCGSAAKSPAVWSDGGLPSTGRIPALPKSGSLSICRYHGTGDQEGSLTLVGFRSAAQVQALMPTLSATPPAGCDPKADPMQTPSGDWLMFYRAPKPPYRADGAGSELIALLELSHCRRWVEPGRGVAGYADAAGGAALAALADRANKRSA